MEASIINISTTVNDLRAKIDAEIQMFNFIFILYINQTKVGPIDKEKFY